MLQENSAVARRARCHSPLTPLAPPADNSPGTVTTAIRPPTERGMDEGNPHAQRKLGDILVECQVVTQAQVDAALAEQRKTGKMFGESLLDLGFISEDDLGWALSTQLNVPYIDIHEDMVDRAAVR